MAHFNQQKAYRNWKRIERLLAPDRQSPQRTPQYDENLAKQDAKAKEKIQ